MGKGKSDAVRMIDEIDQNLLNLYYTSENKTEYKFFDFFGALKLLNEYVLKDGGRREYFNFKANQYRNVFNDLMFFESEVKYSEFLSYDPEKRIAKYLIRTHTTNEVGVKENIKELVIDEEWEHKSLIKDADTLIGNPVAFKRTEKYSYILQGCHIKEEPDIWWNRNFKAGFDDLFRNYNLDLKIQITFEDYIKKLIIQTKEYPENKSDNATPKINPIASNTLTTKTEYMNPLKYLKHKKDDIYFNLVKQNRFTNDEAEKIYKKLNDIVNTLIPLRHSEKLTEEILLAIEKMPDKNMRIIQDWLIKAIKNDDSFVRAYIPLAQTMNCRSSMGYYKLKDISDSKLFNLLEEEKNVEINENPLIFEESITSSKNINIENSNEQKRKGRTAITPDFTVLLNSDKIKEAVGNEPTIIKDKLDKLVLICKEIFNPIKSDLEHAMNIDSLIEFDLLKIKNVGLKGVCRSLCDFIKIEFKKSYYESIRKVYNTSGSTKHTFKVDNYLKTSLKERLIAEGILNIDNDE